MLSFKCLHFPFSFIQANATLKQKHFNKNDHESEDKENLKDLTQDEHIGNEERDYKVIILN